MKRLTFSLLMILLVGNVFSQVESKKEMTHTFKDVKNSEFHFSSFFSDITVEYWDKDEIDIWAEVTAKAKNKKKADKLLSRITFNCFSNAKSFNAHIGWKKNITIKNDNLKIKCVIKAPENMIYHLSNHFGKVSIPKITDPASSINLEFGSLFIDEMDLTDVPLGKTESIRAMHSKVNIRHCSNAKIFSSFSDVRIKKGKNIDLTSRYSDDRIKEIDVLSYDGEHSQLRIDEVDVLNIKSNFSDIDVDLLNSKMRAKSDYGNLQVDLVSPQFEKIDIEMDNGDVELTFSPEVTYSLDALCTGTIELPKNAQVKTTSKKNKIKNFIVDGNENMRYGRTEYGKTRNHHLEKLVTGVVGDKSKTPKAEVRIESRGGDIEID